MKTFMSARENLYTDESVKARASQDDPIIMYLVVRTDLNMSAGKIAAQCGHAVGFGAIQFDYLKSLPETFVEGTEENKAFLMYEAWLNNSYRKVVLDANDKKWNKLKEHYKDSGLLFVVVDAGLTEVDPNTETVAMIWPMKRSSAPQVLKKMQTLK